MKIPVMEVFGPTIQGEGMVIGQKTMFVRTAGCDYSCNWCDSKFTWDGTGKSTMMTSEQIIDSLLAIGENRFSHVTISGGNPLLHKGLGVFIAQCKERGWKTAIETQGSLWQEWLLSVDDITISPKPPSSGMTTDFEKLEYMMDRLRENNVSFKVVVFDDIDFQYAENLHARYPDVPFYLQVGNPDVVTTDDAALTATLLSRLEWLTGKTVHSSMMNTVRVLPQLHALMWGNKRGV
ncbi:7-carboxy-7-deazaguanine synthase QueE [Paenisporosarcina cavernae]|uniref:7-carboxy-7-deazaguanine synthase n=1 Tax=Paenisporosarcina cavernae TaxID=2320858 RepID=A0A385YQ87_9BACL|nr:7-carboxy-7-deazaguanine synthase QueE [Paenisporosarcina cavernae]AYC28510.1 7-carboxy-7-deazaguanine synthase QueE [Paenisporosarcina cavernae]